MDRQSIWVGIGAVVVVIIAIVFIVRYAGSGGDEYIEGAVGLKFQCDACGEVFVVERKELDDPAVHEAYVDKFGETVACRQCGEDAAYQVYLCRKCGDKYYKYDKARAKAEFLKCPAGHPVPVEDE